MAKLNNVVEHESVKTPIGDKFLWIDRAMAKAIGDPAGVTEFELDFANDTANRLGRHGVGTLFTAKQMAVARRIAHKVGEMP